MLIFTSIESGLITVSGALAQTGTFELLLDPGFDANIGDQFTLLTTTTGLTGAFDAFQGFEIGNGKAFELITVGNNLVARVTTLAAADSLGFVNGAPFTPAPRPVDGRTDVTLDVLTGTLQDVTVTGRTTGSGPVEMGTPILANVELATDVAGTLGTSDQTVTVTQGFDLDGATLSLASGTATGEYRLRFLEEQTLGGTGVLEFLRNDLGTSGAHTLVVADLIPGEEVLTIGPDVTIRGHVSIFGENNDPADHIRILGTVEGVDGSTLYMGNLDNAGGTVSVDASEGLVLIGRTVRNTIFEEVGGTSGGLEASGLTLLQDVTFGMDLLIDDAGTSRLIDVYDGLELRDDAVITLQGWDHRVELEFFGSQSVTGTGVIDMVADPFGGQTNVLRLDGLQEAQETLTFGAGITLRGTGSIGVEDAGDTLAILGTLQTLGGTLSVSNLDNGGGTMTVDASGGDVVLSWRIADVTIAEAVGNTGDLKLNHQGTLDDVTLGMDVLVDAAFGTQRVYLQNGLTLDGGDLILGGSEFAGATVEPYAKG